MEWICLTHWSIICHALLTKQHQIVGWLTAVWELQKVQWEVLKCFWNVQQLRKKSGKYSHNRRHSFDICWYLLLSYRLFDWYGQLMFTVIFTALNIIILQDVSFFWYMSQYGKCMKNHMKLWMFCLFSCIILNIIIIIIFIIELFADYFLD